MSTIIQAGDTLNVTNVDIQTGEPGECETCAVVLAVVRQFGYEQGDIAVLPNVLIDRVNQRGFKLPEQARDFVFDYDTIPAPHSLAPFDFRIGAPIVVHFGYAGFTKSERTSCNMVIKPVRSDRNSTGVPLSIDWQDVTCKRCLRYMPKDEC